MSKVPPAARAARPARTSTRRRARLIWSSVGAVLVGAIATVVVVIALAPTPPACVRLGPDTIGKKRFAAPPCDLTQDIRNRFFAAHIETSLGSITINLDAVLAPATVNNFVFLARAGFYDGQTFRVDAKADHAVVQTGDPKGDGTGGPGYTYAGETPSPITRYVRGVVAMANIGNPSSNGSQFFIVVRDYEALSTPNTTPSFTFFGFVPDGASLAVLDRMIAVPLKGRYPVTPIRINKVTIEDLTPPNATSPSSSPTPS